MFILDQLKAEHRYARLEARGRRKQRYLAERGLENPTVIRAGTSEDELWEWYFARLGALPPEDLAKFATSMDFVDEEHFLRIVLREYCFAQAAVEEPSGSETPTT